MTGSFRISVFIENVRQLTERLGAFNGKVASLVTKPKADFIEVDFPNLLKEIVEEPELPLQSYFTKYIEFLLQDVKYLMPEIAHCDFTIGYSLSDSQRKGYWLDSFYDEVLNYYSNVDALKKLLSEETGEKDPLPVSTDYKPVGNKNGAGRPTETLKEKALLTRQEATQFLFLLSEMRLIPNMNKSRVAETFRSLTDSGFENNRKALANDTGLLDPPKKEKINDLLSQIIKVIKQAP